MSILRLLVVAASLSACSSATPLEITPAKIDQLRELRSVSKFGPDNFLLYPGAPTELIRLRCERNINGLIDYLISNLDSETTTTEVLQEFSLVLVEFNNEDSEEGDRALSYLEEIMDILEIASSNGLLNDWRYKFQPQ